MILHIPHSSRVIDGHIELENEQANLDYLTDTDTDILFSYWGCDIIKFPLSRFVCDVERLEKDEPMEKCGRGIIYRKDAFGNDIKRITPDELIYKMYHMHHNKLTMVVNRQLAYHENVVIVDCHSFTSFSEEDPDVCIGINSMHTPNKLIDLILGFFDKRGISTEIDDPYKGTMVTLIHMGNKNVQSVMIEINKNVYTNDVYSFEPIITKLLENINNYEWLYL
jgi:N-formylglutamate amidohydrolase